MCKLRDFASPLPAEKCGFVCTIGHGQKETHFTFCLPRGLHTVAAHSGIRFSATQKSKDRAWRNFLSRMASGDASTLHRMLAESVQPTSSAHHKEATAFLATFLPQSSAWGPLLSSVEQASSSGDGSTAFVAANAILEKVCVACLCVFCNIYTVNFAGSA